MSYKVKTVKSNVIEDVEYDVDEIHGPDFAKAAARVFDTIYHGQYGVLILSTFVDLIETLGGGVP